MRTGPRPDISACAAGRAGAAGIAPTRWLVAGSRSILAISAALPVMAVLADRWIARSGNLVLGRLCRSGRCQQSASPKSPRPKASTRWSRTTAGLLADMFFTLRDAGPDHQCRTGPRAFRRITTPRSIRSTPRRRATCSIVNRSCGCRTAPVRTHARAGSRRAGRRNRVIYTREITAWRMPRDCWFPDRTGG